MTSKTVPHETPQTRIVPFEPRRFASAARYYRSGRPAYAPRLIELVADRCALDGTHRVLDLGCGPGPLAIAFARHVREVVAIDPEPEMLRIAAEEAAAARLPVTIMKGSSFDLGPHLGRFRLATIGRAFHWMDRAATLDALDRLLEPDGAVALFADRHPEVPENAWRKAFEQLVETYSARDPDHPRQMPGWLRHEAVLLASRFSRLERVSVIERRLTPVERFVDRIQSLSPLSEGRIGLERSAALKTETTRLMTAYAVAGRVAEVVETEALIAWRPQAGEPEGPA